MRLRPLFGFRWQWLWSLVAVGLLILPLFVSAGELDLSLEGIGRSYPQGGSLDVSTGYGWTLWGDPAMTDEGPSKPWYGYLRGALDVAIAGTYNSAALKLEVFPLSILGMKAGAEVIDNNKDYVGFDCESIDCHSPLQREFVEGQLALGAGPVFLVAQARRQRLEPKSGDSLSGPFLDISTALEISQSGEEMRVFNGFLGLELSSTWSLVYYSSYAETEESRQIQRMHLLNAFWRQDQWSLSFGGGTFESSLKKRGATAVIRLGWTPYPSLSLF